MVTTTFHHRILPHYFLAPPPQAAAPPVTLSKFETKRRLHSSPAPLLSARSNLPYGLQNCNSHVASCLPSSSSSSSSSSFSPPRTRTRLFVSGLSFRTTEDSLRNAFKNFGELVEVNLVMDKIANRPRGFAFLRYATEEESKKAIDGMHGKFLDGRVIFVEVAKSRAELHRGPGQSPS
ncbi:Organelle RRM domain-containing protein 6, chloroplastic [Sesamum angolense]|uniref:Organelle RRM domain-containing protein 6, chloroplastic n=1 Tax=Sesamum angolense TaxID=2727404 RepID=A0AAE2BYV5_9LAMI|nr:Organelle RRM domain-containing protein 6, chloroplastic [Sesamum angolense]